MPDSVSILWPSLALPGEWILFIILVIIVAALIFGGIRWAEDRNG